MQRSCVHQISKFLLIHGSRNYQVGNTTEICNIVSAMVCRTICTGKTSSIQTEYYRQFLKADIVHHLIVGTLHKGRVNVTERH